MLEIALQFAARGWRVFPCHTTISGACSCGRNCGRDAGKHPTVRKGVRAATTNPAQIRAWWSRNPAFNIGIATGNGLIVIDLDGTDEIAAVAAAREHSGLPPTRVVQTGRGVHAYFTGDLSGSRKVNIGGKPILIRGEGGYVLGAGSLHASGRRYQVVSDLPLAEFPQWISNLAQTTENKSLTSIIKTPKPDYLTTNLRPVLSKSLQAIAPEWNSEAAERIESALKAIPASCERDTWLKVGFALHSLAWQRPDGSDQGFDIWRDWSSTCPEKFSDHDVETRWRSFKKSGINIGSLYHVARGYGWDDASAPGGALFELPKKLNGHALPTTVDRPFPDLDKNGRPRNTFTNCCLAIQKLGIRAAYDDFHHKAYLGNHPIERFAGEISDMATHALRPLIRSNFGFDAGKDHIDDAVISLAVNHSYDPIVEYLDSLAWDGTKRLDRWLTTYMHATDTALTHAIGRLALIAAVRRVRQPGCKFDQIIVLEGPEGRGKSTAIEILAGRENFSDAPILGLPAREQQEAVEGVWLYELGELVGLRKAEIEHVKMFASRTVDRARPAYGRHRIDRSRRCVFFATTNDSHYLLSQTGNRRFWPVTVKHIDLAALARDRDQLWAEAATYDAAGASIMLPEQLWSAVGQAQAERLEEDPWEIILNEIRTPTYINGNGKNEYRISSQEVFAHLNIPTERLHSGIAKRISYIMSRGGWEGPKMMRIKLGEIETAARGYSKPTTGG